jgi:CubicO group peptidase (beta-lactamase class C family)
LSSGASPHVLAAYLLEQASGRAWIDYVRTNIFRRARMRETGLEGAGTETRAIGYVRATTGTISLAPAQAGSRIVAPDVVSGLWGSVGDFVRFDNALWRGGLVSPAGLAFLSEISLPVERDRGVGWSCCWLVGKTPEGEEVHLHGAHSGLLDGFYSGYARYPERS